MRPSEHEIRFVDVAAHEGVTDARARKSPLVVAAQIERAHGKTVHFAEALERREIARALVTEAEVAADDDELRFELANEEVRDEPIGRPHRERVIEALHDDLAHARALEELDFPGERRQYGRRRSTEGDRRMRVEREDGVLRVSKDLLVPAVNAVEISNRYGSCRHGERPLITSRA